MPAASWYYILDGQRRGPVEAEEIARLAADGTLGPADLVWNPSLGSDWVPLSRVPGLAAGPSPAEERLPSPAPSPGGFGSTPNDRLMQKAQWFLRGNWLTAVGAALLYGLVRNGISFVSEIGSNEWKLIASLFELLWAVFIAAPMLLGWNRFFLLIVRRRRPDFNRLFDGFRLYWKTIGTSLLIGLLVMLAAFPVLLAGIVAAVFLPAFAHTGAMPLAVMLVAVLVTAALIPSMIVGLNYSQSFFILSDHPDLSVTAVLSRSREMMVGYRWKRVCLDARFIGWFLLGILTCFIGFLWIGPYLETAHALFYEDIRIEPEPRT